MPVETFATLAETTTTADPGSGGTSLAVTSRTLFPQSGQFRILVQASETDKTNREIMLVTAGQGTGAGSFTVTRAPEGPAASAHASGSYVAQALTAAAVGGKSDPDPGTPGLRSSELVAPVSGDYMTSQFGDGNATSGLALNDMYAMPIFLLVALSFNTITVKVATAAATAVIRLGAYAASATTNKPGTLLFDAGTVDSSTTGVKSITITQTLGPGLVWLVAAAQVVLSQWVGFTRYKGPALALGANSLVVQTPGQNFYYVTATSGALPASPTWALAANASVANCPIVGLVKT